MFEVFDHTADIGIRASAPSLESLFVDAAKGLTSLFLANPSDIQSVHSMNVRVDGRTHDLLLFDWLTELLYAFETSKMLFQEFRVTLDENGLSAVCVGEVIDPAKHQLEHEVKAITYHQLKVERQRDGWLAEIIVDI